MHFMLTDSMESVQCQNTVDDTENKTEVSENASDRESSIESFHTNKSEISIATETELIDVDDIELSDEESWLYKSPKKLSADEKSVSTQRWLQKGVEDMDDMELTATRTALLSKLNELKLLNSKIEEKARQDLEVKAAVSNASNLLNDGSKNGIQEIDNAKTCSVLANVDEKNVSLDVSAPKKVNNVAENDNCNSKEFNQSEIGSQQMKEDEVLNVVDVQKIAKLQEESLKQSMYKFLSQTGRKTPSSRDLSPVSPAQALGLNKPASVEALNTCVDKTNHSNIYSMVPLQGMRKPSMFNSASALSSQELYRGSLPNINKGYYSLKTRKTKHPSDAKISCPLPIYPTHSKVVHNGTTSQAPSSSQIKSKSNSYDHRESRTLPSSYRVHSRSQSSSRRDLNAFVCAPAPRRESVPILGNNSTLEPSQKDNHRKFSSPVSSLAVHPRYATSSSALSPTKPFTSQTLRSPQSLEYHRAASHSPSRRLPLSTVQQQSPKKGTTPSPRNGEIRTLKVPSKIPSPTLRSGIPVPSTYISRANEDDSWSQDCF